MIRLLAPLSIATIIAAALFGSRAPGQGDATDLQRAIEQIAKAAQSAQANAAPAKAIELQDLKALMPEQLAGLRRTSISAEKNTVMGMQVAMVEADYQLDEQKTLHAKLTDLAGMGPMGAIAHAGWALAEIDRESDAGYERTTNVAGHKALEKWEKAGTRGTVQILVAGRFMVEIEGHGLEMAIVQKATGELDLAKLAALAK